MKYPIKWHEDYLRALINSLKLWKKEKDILESKGNELMHEVSFRVKQIETARKEKRKAYDPDKYCVKKVKTNVRQT